MKELQRLGIFYKLMMICIGVSTMCLVGFLFDGFAGYLAASYLFGGIAVCLYEIDTKGKFE